LARRFKPFFTGNVWLCRPGQGQQPKPKLELALEMNHKLQQITEDTMLKNIQLQESLDAMSQLIGK
jgi:hypothetical protein